MGSLTLTVTLAPALARTRTRTVPLPLTKVCIVDSLADLLASQGVEGIDEMDADTDELLDALAPRRDGLEYRRCPARFGVGFGLGVLERNTPLAGVVAGVARR